MATDLLTYIPLREASERYGVARKSLTQLVDSGRIRAVNINGGIAVAEEDVKGSTIHKEDFRHLDGQAIHVAEAGRKYALPTGSLSRWATAGHIQVLGTRKNQRLLNEADVAYIRALIDATGGPRPGRALSKILP